MSTSIIPQTVVKVKCVFYARYSSANQREQSIEGQRSVCERYATDNNLDIVGEYVDRAKSGRHADKRPQFQQMISDIESGRIAVAAVLIYKLDRFARNRTDSVLYKAKLRDLGVRVISATEQITDTPEGVVMESLLEGMDEYYSLELARKMKRGKEESLKKGQFAGGKPPFGYKVENHRLVIDPVNAQHVQTAFQMYASGARLMDIVRHINAVTQTNRGKHAIQRLLHNRLYTGEDTYGEYENHRTAPPIIDTDLFETVQALLAQAVHRYREHRTGYHYMLTGRIWCAQCGGRMSGSSTKSSPNTARRYYYRCACSSKQKADDAHERVLSTLVTYLTPERVEYIASAAYESYENDQPCDPRPQMRQEIDGINRQLENATAAILNGLYSQELHDKITALESRRSDLQAQIDSYHEPPRYTKGQFVTAFAEIAAEPPEELFRLFVPYVIRDEDRLIVVVDLSGENTGEKPNFEELCRVAFACTHVTLHNRPALLLSA